MYLARDAGAKWSVRCIARRFAGFGQFFYGRSSFDYYYLHIKISMTNTANLIPRTLNYNIMKLLMKIQEFYWGSNVFSVNIRWYEFSVSKFRISQRERDVAAMQPASYLIYSCSSSVCPSAAMAEGWRDLYFHLCPFWPLSVRAAFMLYNRKNVWHFLSGIAHVFQKSAWFEKELQS